MKKILTHLGPIFHFHSPWKLRSIDAKTLTYEMNKPFSSQSSFSIPSKTSQNTREGGGGVKREDLKEKSQEKQSAKIQSTLPIITASLIRGAFRTLSNIYDGAFCENNGHHTHMTSTLRGSVLDVQSLFFYYRKFFNKSHPLMIPLHCLWT